MNAAHVDTAHVELAELVGTYPVNAGNLVENDLLSSDELAAYEREWEEHARDPRAFFVAPPVMATILEKRRA